MSRLVNRWLSALLAGLIALAPLNAFSTMQQLQASYGIGDPQTDPDWASVVLLMHCDGTNGNQLGASPDSSNSAHDASSTGSPGGPVFSNTQSKFGGTSCLNTRANSNFIVLGVSLSDFAFGTGNYTIEAWVYGDFSGASNNNGIFASANHLVGTEGMTFHVTDTCYGVFKSGGAGVHAWCPSGGANQWNHIAISRSGTGAGGTKFFFNGVSIADCCGGTGADANNYVNTSGVGLLKWKATNESCTTACFNGYIDEIRITKGVARYTANFTPRSTPFPNQ